MVLASGWNGSNFLKNPKVATALDQAVAFSLELNEADTVEVKDCVGKLLLDQEPDGSGFQRLWASLGQTTRKCVRQALFSFHGKILQLGFHDVIAISKSKTDTLTFDNDIDVRSFERWMALRRAQLDQIPAL
jgi:hypothetical protein